MTECRASPPSRPPPHRAAPSSPGVTSNPRVNEAVAGRSASPHPVSSQACTVQVVGSPRRGGRADRGAWVLVNLFMESAAPPAGTPAPASMTECRTSQPSRPHPHRAAPSMTGVTSTPRVTEAVAGRSASPHPASSQACTVQVVGSPRRGRGGRGACHGSRSPQTMLAGVGYSPVVISAGYITFHRPPWGFERGGWSGVPARAHGGIGTGG